MFESFMLRIAAAGCIGLRVAFAAIADDKGDSQGPGDELRRTTELIEAELPRWEVARGTEAVDLKLDPKPILRWTNPATGRMHGEIYVWTMNGRPECIMSLYKVWEPAWGFAGELQSLSAAKLVAKRSQSMAWKCDEPGVTFRDVPEAPAVAETPARRLRQMRDVADDFTAVLTDYRQNKKGERQELRLLTNAVYRYASPDRDVTDGAMFAFVLGTDAEMFLLLEARGAKNENRWQYALARLNCDELAASWKEREVWRVDRATYNERNKPFAFMSLPEVP
ncbi:MAG TPA: hypothetical protein VHC22_14290 [Pirellulales bacterium]|nr:hypothetical protein [Pirellulales bacterium]